MKTLQNKPAEIQFQQRDTVQGKRWFATEATCNCGPLRGCDTKEEAEMWVKAMRFSAPTVARFI